MITMRHLIVAVLLVGLGLSVASAGPGTLREYTLYKWYGDASMNIEAELAMKGVPEVLWGVDYKGNRCSFPVRQAWSECSELGGRAKYPEALKLVKNWNQLSPHQRSDLVAKVYETYQDLDLECQYVDKILRIIDEKAGTPGPTGPQGLQGEKGDKGDKGDIGTTGANGADGATGPAGPAGANAIQGAICQYQVVKVTSDQKQTVIQSGQINETAITTGDNSPIGLGGASIANSVALAQIGPIVAIGGQTGVIVQIRWKDPGADWTPWYVLNGRDGRDAPAPERIEVAPISAPPTPPAAERKEEVSALCASVTSPALPTAVASTEQTEEVEVVAPITQTTTQKPRSKQTALTTGTLSPIGQGGTAQSDSAAKAAVGPVTSTGGQASVANSIVINNAPALPSAALPATGGISWRGTTTTSTAPVGGGMIGGMEWFIQPGTCAPGGTPPPQPMPR